MFLILTPDGACASAVKMSQTSLLSPEQIKVLPAIPSEAQVESFLTVIKNKRVTVLGDLMMDENARGREAGMVADGAHPFVVIGSIEYLPGGAANAAMNLRALGLNVRVLGVVGNDQIGRRLVQLLKDAGVDTSGVIVDPSRPTTHKQRIWMSGQQMIRVDTESTLEISDELASRLFESAMAQSQDAILVSDYGKGVVTKSLSQNVLTWARLQSLPSIVDPKGTDYSKYRNADLVKPNESEAHSATGRSRPSTEEQIFDIALKIQEKSGIRNVVISRSEKGMILQLASGEKYKIPTIAHQVSDVVGAGDTVVASLAAGLAAHLPLDVAMQIANFAAGIKVRDHHGVYAVTREDLSHESKSSK